MVKLGHEEVTVPEKTVTLGSQVRGTPAPRGRRGKGWRLWARTMVLEGRDGQDLGRLRGLRLRHFEQFGAGSGAPWLVLVARLWGHQCRESAQEGGGLVKVAVWRLHSGCLV